jgi:hypothetical protein
MYLPRMDDENEQLHKSDIRELWTHFRHKFSTCEYVLSFFCSADTKSLCKIFPGRGH